jgi:hypothetical protein
MTMVDIERDSDGKFAGSGGGSASKPHPARAAGRSAGKELGKAILAGASRFKEGVHGAGEKSTAAADALIRGDLDPLDALEAGRLAFSGESGGGKESKERGGAALEALARGEIKDSRNAIEVGRRAGQAINAEREE